MDMTDPIDAVTLYPSTAMGREQYSFHQMVSVGVPERIASNLAATFSVTSYSEGANLVEKGSRMDSWNLLVDGYVIGSVETKNSKFTPITIYNGGSWFGEHSLINKRASYMDYVALTSVEIFRVPKDTFSELFETVPSFTQSIAELISWRVQKTAETLMLMKLGSLSLRVVMGIAQFAEAFNAKSQMSDATQLRMEIPINQNMLASLCGVSRSELSDHLQQLKNAGWIKISYGKIELIDLRFWEHFARRQRERKVNNLSPRMNELLVDMDQCQSTLGALQVAG